MIIHDFVPAGKQPKITWELMPSQKMLLMPIGDVHAFSAGWPEQRFKDHLQWGADRGAYFLGMGEYLDFTSHTQRMILQDMRETQRAYLDGLLRNEVERLAKIMQPTVGNWIGLLEGHHYHQFLDGTTSDQYLCQLLGTQFLGTSTLLNIRLNSATHHDGCTVTIFAHHGPAKGGSRKQGGKLNRLEDLLSWIEADIYLMGHDHSKVNTPMDRLYRTESGHLYHRTKILARTGGWMVGYEGVRPQEGQAALSRGSYVEQAALGPTSLGAPIFSIGMKRMCKDTDFMIPDLHYSV